VPKRLFVPFLVLLALVGLVAACGDDDDSTKSASGSGTHGKSSASTTAPEEKRASDAEVAAGLKTLDKLGQDIAAAIRAGDKDKAKDLLDQIEPTWQDIEGTIKANGENLYLQFEDAFAAIRLASDDADGEKAQTTAGNISAAVAIYLQAHPA